MKDPYREVELLISRPELLTAIEKVNHEYLNHSAAALSAATERIRVATDMSPVIEAVELINRTTNLITGALRIESMQIISEAVSAFQRNIELATSVAGIGAALQRAMAPAANVFEEARKALEAFTSQKRWKTAAEKYARIMIEAEWPPVLDIPIRVIYKINDLYDQQTIQEFKLTVSEILKTYYDDAKLRAKLSKWAEVPILERRKSILTEIIDAYLLEKYFLVVPCILVQIEGLLGDIASHKGMMRLADIERYLTELFDNRLSASPFDQVKSLIMRKVYESFEWGDAISSSISRHAIVHGADTNYGSKESALKCICLFDYVVYYHSEKFDL